MKVSIESALQIGCVIAAIAAAHWSQTVQLARVEGRLSTLTAVLLEKGVIQHAPAALPSSSPLPFALRPIVLAPRAEPSLRAPEPMPSPIAPERERSRWRLLSDLLPRR